VHACLHEIASGSEEVRFWHSSRRKESALACGCLVSLNDPLPEMHIFLDERLPEMQLLVSQGCGMSERHPVRDASWLMVDDEEHQALTSNKDNVDETWQQHSLATCS
jgi:hypothetical protein